MKLNNIFPFNKPNVIGYSISVIGFVFSILVIIACIIGWFITPFYLGYESCCLLKIIIVYIVTWVVGLFIWCWPLFLAFPITFFSEYLETHYNWFPEPEYCSGCYGECGEYCDQE